MKTEKELIELMINNFDEYIFTGLKRLISTMTGCKIISIVENHVLVDLITKHTPKKIVGDFCWSLDEKGNEKRKEFLINLYKKL